MEIVIIGGCGHVGLPLGIAFASRGRKVCVYDLNDEAVATVNSGTMPFAENGASDVLAEVVGAGLLVASSDPSVISDAQNVIVVIGTPVDEHLNPSPQAVPLAIEAVLDHLVDGQLLVLRSTLYPGVTAMVEKVIARAGRTIDVAFCPERIAEGYAMTELFQLPQIVSGRTDAAAGRAEELFRVLTDKIVRTTPEEAELAKLFTNAWRYIKFATANQFYIIANDFGLDFETIRKALAFEYPRAQDMPSAGFAAGPCLFKDTMQLAAFNNNNFLLGHAGMMVNEGLPLYLVARIEQRFDLSKMTVGILGMAFKAESDDTRSSLSYKLKRILEFRAEKVLCSDPYVTTDPKLVPDEQVLAESDLIVVGAPHRCYAALDPQVPVVDIWNVFGKGVRV
ncbi:MAG TPA: nucleotide sugar dehydrogenase [Actinomycetota bacterium]|jgi:UDP-N-acetyl-D-mannosaminuronic acid dehydrogenase|nr:nucleotide sugar dehydrogenase [Actinomycetota bacterium]